MPITAETFDVTHFDALHRGLDAAQGAMENREKQVSDLADERDKLTDEVQKLRGQVEEMEPQAARYVTLKEAIEDVDRGITSLSELLDVLRELEGAYA